MLRQVLLLLLSAAAMALSSVAVSQTAITEFPYWCDFEDNIPEWTLVNGSQTNYWIRGNATSSSSWEYGSKSLYITNGSGNQYYSNDGGFNVVFAYVTLDLTAGQYELLFDWKCNGETDGDFLRVALVPDNVSLVSGDTTGWSATTTPGIAVDGGSQLNGRTTWYEFYDQIFSVPTSGTYKLVFCWLNDPYVGSQPPAAIDNIYFDQLSCPFMSEITVSNVTTSSATLSWTGGAGLYEIWYGTHGFYMYNGTHIVVNDTTVSLTGLQTGAYDVYVSKICGAGDTSYPVQASFATPIAIPYSCDFESAASRSVWQFDNGSYTNKWCIKTDVNNGGSYSMYISTNNSTYYCNQTSQSSVYAYTKVYFDEGYYQMDFDWQCYYSSSNGYMKAFLQKEAVWTASHSANGLIDLGQGQMAASSSGWNSSTKQFSITEAGNYYVVFYWYNLVAADGQTSYYYTPGAVDNIQIKSACASPSNLACSDVTTTTATFTWQRPSSETGNNYIVELYDSYLYYNYGVYSQQQAVSDTTVTLTGLTAGTEYYFAVKYVCAPGDTSERVYTTFTTMATVPLTLPYNCNFESGAGSEWSFYNSTNNNTNNWFVGTAANNTTGGSNAMYISNDEGVTNAATYDYGYSGSSYAYLPLTVPAGSYSISYDWRAGGDYNNWLRAALIPVAQGYSSGSWYWNRDNGGNTPGIALDGDAQALYDATQWQHFSTEFEVVEAGNYYLVFYWKIHSYLSDGADPLPAAVDNIVLTALTCPAPSNLTATYTDGNLNLTWTPGGTETSWRVNDGTTDHVVTTPSFAITGAEPTHQYTFSVTALCGTGDESIPTSLVYTTDYWCPGMTEFYTTDTLQSTGTAYDIPINVSVEYSFTEIIFDQSELGDTNFIHAIAFYYEADSEADSLTGKNDVDIYIMPTTKTAFIGDNDYVNVDESATLVYSGPINCKNGWNYFELQTPYLHLNGNLLMVIDDNSGSNLYNNGSFRTRQCSGNRTLNKKSAAYNIDPQHPDNIAATAYAYQYRPEMRLLSCGIDDIFHHVDIQTTGLGHVTLAGPSLTNGDMVFHNTQITITATPDNDIYILTSLMVNGVEVSNPYTMTVTDDVTIQAIFQPNTPELHVGNLTCSEILTGQEVSVSWTVTNEGLAATASGAVWYDQVYITSASPNDYIEDLGLNNYLLGILDNMVGQWENLNALGSGQSYTRTVNFTLPIDHPTGTHYVVVALRNSPDDLGDDSNHVVYIPVVISLPPLADLQPSDVTVAPSTFFSGSDITVTATVTNNGAAPTRSNGWLDVLYVSNSSTFDTTVIPLATQWHDAQDAPLTVGASYNVTFSATSPLRIFGETYYYVVCNDGNSEFEHAGGVYNNIARSNVVTVSLTAPADLVVSNIVVADTISNRDTFSVTYTVTNQGSGEPDMYRWIDKIYLSTTPTLDTNSYLLGEEERGSTLAPGHSYTRRCIFSLPDSIPDYPQFGQYYVIVVTDADNQVFEYHLDILNGVHEVGETNNYAVDTVQATTYHPDFVISSLSMPDTIVQGYVVGTNFAISNIGELDYSGPLHVAVYYSTTNQLAVDDGGNILSSLIDSVFHNVTIASNDQQIINQLLTIPYNIDDGDYFLFYVLNHPQINSVLAPQSVHSELNLSNNTYTLGPVRFCRTCPRPDLEVLNLTLPATVTAGYNDTIEFDVRNNGTVNLNGDYIFSALHVSPDGGST